jgi:hypothetical protein
MKNKVIEVKKAIKITPMANVLSIKDNTARNKPPNIIDL